MIIDNKLINEIASCFVGNSVRISYKSGTGKRRSVVESNLIRSFPEMLLDFPQLKEISWAECDEVSLKILDRIKSKTEIKEELCEKSVEEFNSKYILCHSVDTANYFIFSKKDNCYLSHQSDTFLDRYPSKARAEIKLNAKVCKLKYDALEYLKPMLGPDNDGVYSVNLYKPPLWRRLHKIPRKNWLKNPPDLMARLSSHIYADKESEVVAWSWWANAIRIQNRTIFSNRGERGVGKTLWAKACAAAIGDFYFPRRLSQFNADLKNKRIIVADDQQDIMGRSGNALRKTLTDSIMTYEEKFVQTKLSERNFASFCINSNPNDDFYVEHDERLLVQPDLKTDNAKKEFSEKELIFLNSLTDKTDEMYTEEDLEFLAHLGYYLLHYESKLGTNEPYLGEQFWQDVIESLPAFKRFVVQKITNCEQSKYEYDMLVEDFKQIRSQRETVNYWNTLIKFLQYSFTYKGQCLIDLDSIDNENKTFEVIEEYKEKI